MRGQPKNRHVGPLIAGGAGLGFFAFRLGMLRRERSDAFAELISLQLERTGTGRWRGLLGHWCIRNLSKYHRQNKGKQHERASKRMLCVSVRLKERNVKAIIFGATGMVGQGVLRLLRLVGVAPPPVCGSRYPQTRLSLWLPVRRYACLGKNSSRIITSTLLCAGG